MYLKSVAINSGTFPTREHYPFNIPLFQTASHIDFDAPITFLVGKNGSGKTALLDAIARKSGLLPWGGTKTHRVHGNPYETQLANHISLNLEKRHRYGFHFRAEAFFNFACSLDDIILDDPARDSYFGGNSLNVISHGESFLTFFRSYNFQLAGLYLLDEPEAALSPQSQLEFAHILLDSLRNGDKQYVVATHSPIIMGCPGAAILNFDGSAAEPVDFTHTAHYAFYKEFLEDPAKFFRK
jgi:predicted ATPase